MGLFFFNPFKVHNPRIFGPAVGDDFRKAWLRVVGWFNESQMNQQQDHPYAPIPSASGLGVDEMGT